jgi:hypothetical protein
MLVRDAVLVLQLLLHVLNGVGGLHLKGDGLVSEGFHEDLHDRVVCLCVQCCWYVFLHRRFRQIDARDPPELTTSMV